MAETLLRSIERILDEESAWIARPSPKVTERIALAAGIAGMEINRLAGSDYERDLEAKVARLQSALEYYANPDIYKPHPHGLAFDNRDLSYHAKAVLGDVPPLPNDELARTAGI